MSNVWIILESIVAVMFLLTIILYILVHTIIDDAGGPKVYMRKEGKYWTRHLADGRQVDKDTNKSTL